MAKDLSSEAFRELSGEIREIATLSGLLWAQDNGFQDRVKRIHNEMDQLEDLLSQRSFRQLSDEKKQELRDSLLLSRKELIKSIQAAPCPTDRIQ
jgi:predicted nuclease with TOPRIM domain